MKIGRWIVKALQRQAYSKFYKATKSPQKTQTELLQAILKSNRQTDLGKKYAFSNINSVEEYQSKVPIFSADEYQKFIATCYDGKDKCITHQPPNFFAMTAGSTGSYKYIPITKDLKRQLDQAVLTYNYLAEAECPELADGKIQFIVGSANGGKSPAGVPQGFVSGFNYKNLPKMIRSRFVIPYEVFEIGDAEDRYYAMARFLVAEPDLRAICAISPVNIIRLIESAINNIETLVNDLSHGTLTLKNQSNISHHLLSLLPTQSHLARKLSEGVDQKSDDQALAALLFPNISYCLCWMGGNMSYYIPELKSYLPNISVFEMPFSASEGIFALPYQCNQTGGVLAVQTTFFEFIEENNIEHDHPPTLLAHQLEINKYYYLVISTSGGLYRYNIEDLIKVKCFYNATPVVEFVSKKSRQISIANERLNENQVTEAMLAACEEAAINRPNFILFPCHDKRYRLVVDYLPIPAAQFCELVDKWLRCFSKGYDFEREDQLLLPLEVVESSPESFERETKKYLAQSLLPNAQVKPIHLSNVFDGYKEFVNKSSALEANSTV